jgi:hypothetical protein
LEVSMTASSPSWRVPQDSERETTGKQKTRAGAGKKEAVKEDGRAVKDGML